MWIDVKIPYEPRGRLAFAYNRAMQETSAPWVLLLDHDLFLSLNPHWYDMCLSAVQTVEDDVVLITCTTNGNSDRPQCPVVSINKTADIVFHVDKARKAYKRAGMRMEDACTGTAENGTEWGIAGYFMLIRRSFWENHKFDSQHKGVNKIDYSYTKKILNTGYKIKVLKGLYVYHRKYVRKLNWGFKACKEN